MSHPREALAAIALALSFPAFGVPVDKLRDPFADNSISNLWTVSRSHGSVFEGSGALNLVPDANSGAASLLVKSASSYSFSDSQVAVQAASVPSSAGNVDAQFSVFLDGANYAQWFYQAGSLYAFYSVASGRTQLKRLTYSSTNHRWWRIRESGGTTYWETSPDGAVYAVQASVATSRLFPISSLYVTFYVETFNAGLANPGRAAFANLNVAPSGIAPMSSLVDAFGGTSLGTAWTIRTQTQGTISVGGGSLNFAPKANTGASQLSVQSTRPYSLIGSAGLAQARQVVSSTGSVRNRFGLQIDDSNRLEWWFESGTLYAFSTVNGTRTTLSSLTYDSGQHVWWRIREDAGSVYWETAPDGMRWTTQASVADGALFSLSMLYPTFDAATSGAGSPKPGTARYANFNSAPVDRVPPSVSLSPADGAVLSGTVLVQATATDDVGVVSCRLLLDGSTLLSVSTQPCSVSVDTTSLADGPHTIAAVVYDVGNNPATTTSNVTVQNGVATRDFSISAAPAAAGTNQGATASYSIATATTIGSAQPLTLSVSPLPPGISAVFAPAQITSGDSATLTITAAQDSQPGDVSIVISATGRYTTHSGSVSLAVADVTPPAVQLAPPAGALLSGTVQVVGSAQDNSPSWIASASLLIDGQVQASFLGPTDAADLVHAWDTTAASDGAHSLSIQAQDRSGNVTTLPEWVSVQNTPATRDFSVSVAPAARTISIGGTATYSVSVPTLIGAPQPVALSVLGQPQGFSAAFSPATAYSGATVSLTLNASAAVPPGSYTVTIRVSGVYTSHDAQVQLEIVDTIAPTVTLAVLASPLSGQVQVVGSAQDDVGVTRGEIWLDGAPVAQSLSWTWDTTATADGTHTLAARAFDAAGNMGSSPPVSVQVLNSSLTRDFTVALSSAQQVLQGSSVQYTISTSTLRGAPQWLQLALDSLPLPQGVVAQISPAHVLSGSTATLTLTAALASEASARAIGVVATGVYATRRATSSIQVIDVTPPVVQIDTPADGATLAGVVSVQAHATDNSIGIAGVRGTRVVVDGALVATSGLQADSAIGSWDTTSASDGVHALVASAFDSASNTGTSSVTVTIHNASPTRDFAVSLPASSITLARDGIGTVPLATVETIGAPETLQLSAAMVPLDMTVAFDRPSVLAGDTANATIRIAHFMQPGTYQVRLAARGVYATHAADLTVAVADAYAPTVDLRPASGSFFAGIATIYRSCRDPVALVSCALAIDGVTVMDSIELWRTTYDWDTRTAAEGAHTLTLTGTNAAGFTTSQTSFIQVQNVAVPHDVVWNGGFERIGFPSGFAQWNDSGYVSGTSATHEGAGAATLKNGQWLSQVIALAPGSAATLSVWYRAVLETPWWPPPGRWVEVTVRDRAGTVLTTPLFEVDTDTPEWRLVTADLSNWAGSSVELRFEQSGFTHVDIDSVSVIASPDAVGDPAPCLAGGNVVFLDGSPGNGIVQGMQTQTGGEWTSQVRVEAAGVSGVDVGAHAPDYSWGSFLRFGMRPMTEGVAYEHATRFSYQPFGPGLDVSANAGCNEVAGRYAVHELAVDAVGNLERFTATFEQSCEAYMPVVRGCVHFER